MRVPEVMPSDPRPAPLDLLDSLGERIEELKAEIARVIVGQEAVIDELLVTLLAGGHALLEGVPGLAKTLLVNTVAATLSLKAGRVQFTPDLMPPDVTGTLVVQEDPRTGERRFVFREGPIFTHMLLADEINRTPPKTQAALLEGMSERQVTVAGKRHRLPSPFFVLATQNPIEQEGTYPLPEAQLDRFLLKIRIDYPNFLEEWEIIERTTGAEAARLEPRLSREEILALQRIVRALPVSPHLREYATRLARRTRPDDPEAPRWVKDLVAWGAGPRASQALILAAKARAILQGRFAVTRADVRRAAPAVLRHRLLPNFRAQAEELPADRLVARLLEETPAFREHERYDAVTRALLRL